MAGAISPIGVIAAVLLPPLGVFLARGIGTPFWIGLALTIVGWLPGVIFALAVQINPRLLARA